MERWRMTGLRREEARRSEVSEVDGRGAGIAFGFGPLFFSDGTVLTKIKRAESFSHSSCR